MVKEILKVVVLGILLFKTWSSEHDIKWLKKGKEVNDFDVKNLQQEVDFVSKMDQMREEQCDRLERLHQMNYDNLELQSRTLDDFERRLERLEDDFYKDDSQ